MIKAARNLVNETAGRLAGTEGIAEVYSVGGRYDLVAIVRVSSNEKLADIVTNHMLKIEGIVDTETMVAFRCYSDHDLESMFGIGMESGGDG